MNYIIFQRRPPATNRFAMQHFGKLQLRKRMHRNLRSSVYVTRCRAYAFRHGCPRTFPNRLPYDLPWRPKMWGPGCPCPCESLRVGECRMKAQTLGGKFAYFYQPTLCNVEKRRSLQTHPLYISGNK